MKILVIHNRYQQQGGEDIVFAAERDLLRRAGHAVIEYTRTNLEIPVGGLASHASLAAKTLWARDSSVALGQLLRRERPDIAHLHNTFPLISPAAYYACREANVPVVQTLHNYRLVCPAATLFRDGRICESCVERVIAWPGIVHRCYRKSLTATAAVAAMLAFHRWKGTWTDRVDLYIALTAFARRKFIEGGLPGEKVVVKPNFIHPDPGPRKGSGEYAIFVGRLSEEKGIPTMIAAWQRLKPPVPLRIVGDGPLRSSLDGVARAAGPSAVVLSGRLSHEASLSAVKDARFLIFPSRSYETFGLTAVEAFACGVPVIASRLGAMAEILEDGRTGLHFRPGDPDDLAAKVEWAWSHPRDVEAMGRAARAEFEGKYTAERNYNMLMDIYERAEARSRSDRPQ